MTAKADTQSIVQHYDLSYPPAKVWRALTEPDLLARWLMSTAFDGARQGWEWMVNGRLPEVLGTLA